MRCRRITSAWRWTAPGQTFMSGASTAPPKIRDGSRTTEDTEAIRTAMITLLETSGAGAAHHTKLRILLAPDLASLWYLRTDLLRHLSIVNGEAMGREQVEVITTMFKSRTPHVVS